MTDYKELCGDLLNRLNGLYEELIDAGAGWIPPEAQELMNRAWEAMAEPEPKGPTRRQLLQLAAEFWPEGCEPAQAVPFARAVLARWGRPAPATAGEVGELADFVRGCADDYESHGRCRLIRAADLLERQAAPQPVAVSERLPGPEDCDAEGRCWWWDRVEECWWYLKPINSEQALRSWSWTHWLPAHAMPVPADD